MASLQSWVLQQPRLDPGLLTFDANGQNGLQCCDERRTQVFELGEMTRGQALEQRFTLRCQLHNDLAAVLLVALTGHQSSRLQPVDQPDHAVMPQLKALRQRTYIRLRAGSKEALQREHQLVLLRFQPGPARVFFAETQETSQRIAKIRQGLVIDLV